MKLRNMICIVLCMFGAASGLPVEGQRPQAKKPPATSVASSFTKLTTKEVTLLIADLAATNPETSKMLEQNRDARRAQMDNLKQLLAFARQAEKEGLAAEPLYARELRNIRDETVAVNYDRHVNEDKAPTPPFGSVGDERVSAYWGEGTGKTIPASLKTSRQAKFDEFIGTKVALMKVNRPDIKDRSITDEEKLQAREFYTKVQITAADYAAAKILPLSFKEKVELQVKLQQAQFLARLYAEQIASATVASDDEIASYIKTHPEFDPAAQRTKAVEILGRAKKGEDFAKLANEYSDDPGNKNQQGEPQGGLYKNVGLGVMVVPFERAALALEAGQISPNLVESDFGFHIIKLERKGKVAGADSAETYDVRHILIATGVQGPAGSSGRFVTMKEHVKGILESEKERRIVNDLVVENQISVPEDFTILAAPAAAPVKASATPASRSKTRPARKRH